MEADARQAERIEDARHPCDPVQQLGDRLGASFLAQEVRAQPEQDDLHGDVVEHDRRDDLVGARPRLEEAGDEAPHRPREDARDDRAEEGIGAGRSCRTSNATVEPNAPRMNCPSTPMLNTLVRNATATASPVKISGVAATKVSVSGRTAPAI